MKLVGSVTQVRTSGDQITLRIRGEALRSAAWRFNNNLEIEIPDTKAARKAYYLGREVHLTLAAV